MSGGNLLTYGSVLYSLLLIIIFFSKKRLKNFENKIYLALIISNFIGLIVAIMCYFTVSNYETLRILNYFISRLYLVYLVAFIFLFFYYLIVTIFDNNNITKLKKTSLYLFSATFFITVITIFKLPLYYSNEPGAVYSYGPAANLIYAIATICMCSWTILLLANYKKIKNKKFIPIIVFIIGAMITTIIQRLNPGLLLMTSMETFVVVIMYFTIENPDMKLLEEVHKSKEISDNANEEKTIFLYNMTQEIRNITSKIDDDADLILDSKNLDVAYDSARDIKANTSKFTNMTNEILDVSNIDSSTIKIYNSKYNIKNILKQVINVYGNLCKDKELKFITNIDHDIPEVLYGDSIGLKEVLNTILNNSVKYTNKGYVELSVNTIIKKDICRLIITVEDSGIGIKSEDINKIKVDNKSLAKANKAITLMNGTMLISSDYGIGTKIKLILDQKIEIEENTEVAKYESVFDDINILCVDDSEAGLKIIDKLLKGTKVKIDKAETGKECLDKIKVNKYDLILLDEDLSQITGVELMGKIKEIRNFKTPVILLTKDNSYEYNEEYSKVGFSSYLLKPLKKEILIEKINMYTKKDKK